MTLAESWWAKCVLLTGVSWECIRLRVPHPCGFQGADFDFLNLSCDRSSPVSDEARLESGDFAGGFLQQVVDQRLVGLRLLGGHAAELT